MRVGAIFVAVALLWGGWWLAAGRFSETTDNAYVHGDLITVTPQTVGTVTAVYAEETDYVAAGAPLVGLGIVDADIALDRSVARLAEAVRETAARKEGVVRWEATVALREVEWAVAGAEYRRRRDLFAASAVSAEEFERGEAAYKIAERLLAVDRRRLAEARLAAGDGPVEKQPSVTAAAADVRSAWLTRARSTIVAPVAGYVARRSAQVGQRAEPGKPVMALVAADRFWVEANFKENQLRHMRVGQPAVMTADLYGDDVTFTGVVDGVVAGTGAVFSLLPPQNATGNWIKVVQRTPVRIRLTGESLSDHPLFLGLSMRVSVDTGDRAGAPLARRAPAAALRRTTDVYAGQIEGAEALIAATITANLGGETGR
jgi:membrane fusion protein (multidrug efflux system)